MERNLLVGNGINIQFGGLSEYSGFAIMNRIVENIKSGKYTVLTGNSLTIEEQLEILNGLVTVIDKIKAGKYRNRADGLFMHMELERIARTYPKKALFHLCVWRIISWHLRYLTMDLVRRMARSKMNYIEKLCLCFYDK